MVAIVKQLLGERGHLEVVWALPGAQEDGCARGSRDAECRGEWKETQELGLQGLISGHYTVMHHCE